MKKIMGYATVVVCVLLAVSITLAGCNFVPNAYQIRSEDSTSEMGGALSGELPETNSDSYEVEIPKYNETNDSANSNENPNDITNNDVQDGGQEAKVSVATYIRSKVGSLKVRTGRSTNHSALGTMDKGDMLMFVGEMDGWYTTYFKNQVAYVSSSGQYTELCEMAISEEEKVEQVIKVGAKLLGTPYVYGATRLHYGDGVILGGFKVTAFDCSSLVQYMFYYGANLNLKTTTRTQVAHGKFVSRANLKRGDLMFFTNSSRYNKTGTERIGHVAVYLGDNYILHTASDFAVIEQISSTRWSYFIEGRRMI